jgi:hypothetical protein
MSAMPKKQFDKKKKRRLSSGWGLKLAAHVSPSRRKSMGVAASVTPVLVDENDDNAEKDQRRQQKMEKQRERRKSLYGIGLAPE